MTLPIEPERVAEAIATAAAAAIVPRYRALAAHDIRSKARPDDLVTVADTECQAALTRAFQQLLPHSSVVGEEDGLAIEIVFERIRAADWCWVIDPLDGTYNFVHGLGGFTTMAALLQRGATVAGWIHDPIARETAMAVAGQGACRAGRALVVAEAMPLKRMTGALYVGARRAPALHLRLKQVRRYLGPQSFLRAAGAEYLGLASGRIHYAIFTRLLPWDHAAGSLIFQEAGGTMALLDGSPYRADEDRGIPVLLAPSRESWIELRDFFTAETRRTAP